MARTTHDNTIDQRPEVTVRLADYRDARALVRLAALDSGRVPDGPTLVTELDEQLVAALPIRGGRPLADPFRRTAHLVELLELRAEQMREENGIPAPGVTGRIRAALRTPRPQPRTQ